MIEVQVGDGFSKIEEVFPFGKAARMWVEILDKSFASNADVNIDKNDVRIKDDIGTDLTKFLDSQRDLSLADPKKKFKMRISNGGFSEGYVFEGCFVVRAYVGGNSSSASGVSVFTIRFDKMTKS